MEDTKNIRLTIKNCRIAYPHLFRTRPVEDGSAAKYSACIILDKKACAEGIKSVQAAIDQLTRKAFNGKTLSPDRVCLKDGSTKDGDGFGDGVVFFSANNTRRPSVVNRDLTPLTEEDGVIYAGCYVNAHVSIWAQDDKKYGKRINASIEAVQFVRDGEPLSGAKVDVATVFSAEAAPDDDDSFLR